MNAHSTNEKKASSGTDSKEKEGEAE
jgi:hypothetical protein